MAFSGMDVPAKDVSAFRLRLKIYRKMLDSKDGENYPNKRLINNYNYLFLLPIFPSSSPTHKLCFPSCRPFVVNTTFSTGFVVSSVSTRPVENVMLTTKGLEERKHNL